MLSHPVLSHQLSSLSTSAYYFSKVSLAFQALFPQLAAKIFALLFVRMYRSMFASLTPMILLGATAERGRFAPALVFTFVSHLLSTKVYPTRYKY